MRITNRGIALGEPLENFQGILRGTPVFTDGDRAQLLKDR
jgi:circadian clock protein KaiC